MFQFRVGGGRVPPPQLRVPGRSHPEQDSLPSPGVLTPTLTHTGKMWIHSSPHMHVFGVWEETRVPGENPHRHGRTCKLHIVFPAQNRFYFSRQCCNKTMLVMDGLHRALKTLCVPCFYLYRKKGSCIYTDCFKRRRCKTGKGKMRNLKVWDVREIFHINPILLFGFTMYVNYLSNEKKLRVKRKTLHRSKGNRKLNIL